MIGHILQCIDYSSNVISLPEPVNHLQVKPSQIRKQLMKLSHNFDNKQGLKDKRICQRECSILEFRRIGMERRYRTQSKDLAKLNTYCYLN